MITSANTTKSLLTPSNAQRWLVCTPSARFEEQIPIPLSEYAQEGILAHEVASLMLLGSIYPYRGTDIHQDPYLAQWLSIKENPFLDQEMLDAVGEYVDFCLSIAGEYYVEHQFSLEPFVPLATAQADCTIFNAKAKRLSIVDFKYGKGVKVYAYQNYQAMLYALGALKDLDMHCEVDTVEICIVQPRRENISRWEVTVDELLEWANYQLIPKARLAMGGQGEFRAGSHCKFCKAKSVCRAYYQMFDKVLNLRPKDPRELTDTEISSILLQAKPITTWLRTLHSQMLYAAKRGNVLPGFELVTRGGHRAYKDENEVIRVLSENGYPKDQIFTSKLRSITDLEKHLGKKRFAELLSSQLTKQPGSLSLVPCANEQDDEYEEETENLKHDRAYAN